MQDESSRDGGCKMSTEATGKMGKMPDGQDDHRSKMSKMPDEQDDHQKQAR